MAVYIYRLSILIEHDNGPFLLHMLQVVIAFFCNIQLGVFCINGQDCVVMVGCHCNVHSGSALASHSVGVLELPFHIYWSEFGGRD